MAAANGSGGGGGGGGFAARLSYLNVLPSRQNVIWDDDGPSWSSHLPREPLSLGTTAQAELLITPPRTPILGAAAVPVHMKSALGVDLCELLLPAGQADGDRGGAAPASPLSRQTSPGRASAGSSRRGSGGCEGELSEQDALTVPEAVFNLANTVLGVGVLSVPYAFRLSGYSTLLLIVVTIAVTSRTAGFIGAALTLAARSPAARGVPRRGRDFAFLAQVAFGDRGRTLIGTVTGLEVWFALVTFMVMNGVNASLVWPGVGRTTAVAISCFLAAVNVLLPMRLFSYLSLISSVSLVAAAVAMAGAALTMPSWANPYDHLGVPALFQLQNVPRSVGIIVFCFAGHPCFPVVHECMRDRKSWNFSVGVTFALAFLYYGALGVFGYLVFGTDLEASFTQNLARLEGALFWRTVSALAFLVKIQLTAPLLFNAILVSIWAPTAGGPEWPLQRVLALGLLTGLTALTAVAFSSDVAAVASLTGSLFTMMTSVIFPAGAHLRLMGLFEKQEERGPFAQLPHFLILTFGVLMAASGTALTLGDMLQRQGGG